MTTKLRLSQLGPGEVATVRAVHAEEGLYQRLTALGFRAGKHLHVLRRGILNGPLHIRIGSTEIAIRTADAYKIEVRRDLSPSTAH